MQLIKINYLHKHTLKYNKIIKTKKEWRKSEDYTMCMTTLLFTNFTVAVPSTPAFYAFLKSADGGLAFNFIWKVIP